MKLIALTESYGGRITVSIDWQNKLFFVAPEPEKDRLILIDVPEISVPKPKRAPYGGYLQEGSALYRRLVKYLTAQSEQKETAPRARQINEIPADLWRYAVLDDYVDTDNAESAQWHLSQKFPLADFTAFHAKYGPPLIQELQTALQSEEGQPRINALEEIQLSVSRVSAVLQQTPTRLQLEIHQTLEELGKVLIEAVKAERPNGKLTTEDCLTLFPQMKTDTMRQDILKKFSGTLKRKGVTPEQTMEAIEKLLKNKQARDLTQYNPEFWKPLEKVIDLPANVTGVTIDITEAKEQTVYCVHECRPSPCQACWQYRTGTNGSGSAR